MVSSTYAICMQRQFALISLLFGGVSFSMHDQSQISEYQEKMFLKKKKSREYEKSSNEALELLRKPSDERTPVFQNNGKAKQNATILEPNDMLFKQVTSTTNVYDDDKPKLYHLHPGYFNPQLFGKPQKTDILYSPFQKKSTPTQTPPIVSIYNDDKKGGNDAHYTYTFSPPKEHPLYGDFLTQEIIATKKPAQELSPPKLVLTQEAYEKVKRSALAEKMKLEDEEQNIEVIINPFENFIPLSLEKFKKYQNAEQVLQKLRSIEQKEISQQSSQKSDRNNEDKPETKKRAQDMEQLDLEDIKKILPDYSLLKKLMRPYLLKTKSVRTGNIYSSFFNLSVSHPEKLLEDPVNLDITVDQEKTAQYAQGLGRTNSGSSLDLVSALFVRNSANPRLELVVRENLGFADTLQSGWNCCKTTILPHVANLVLKVAIGGNDLKQNMANFVLENLNNFVINSGGKGVDLNNNNNNNSNNNNVNNNNNNNNTPNNNVVDNGQNGQNGQNNGNTPPTIIENSPQATMKPFISLPCTFQPVTGQYPQGEQMSPYSFSPPRKETMDLENLSVLNANTNVLVNNNNNNSQYDFNANDYEMQYVGSGDERFKGLDKDKSFHIYLQKCDNSLSSKH